MLVTPGGEAEGTNRKPDADDIDTSVIDKADDSDTDAISKQKLHPPGAIRGTVAATHRTPLPLVSESRTGFEPPKVCMELTFLILSLGT